MHRKMLLFAAIVFTALVAATAALASGGGQWWHHTLPNGHVTCNQSNTKPNAPDGGPFNTKADCLASDNGGGGEGNPPPTGWPGDSGTLDGNASGGCNGEDVILTSDETAPGYGAFNFDIAPGTAFQDLGLDFDFTVLSGTQAQSEPYFIVRFTDATQAFVYSVDVNPGEPGLQVFSLTGNTYITRDEAMAQWGEKVVDSVTLAVDNGDLSISAHGLSNDACAPPITSGTFQQVDRVTACASKPILRIADMSYGIYADLDEATFDSGIFQGVTFTASPYVQGVGTTCDIPAGYHFAGYKVNVLGGVDPGALYPYYISG
jgi:hypothetical protein